MVLNTECDFKVLRILEYNFLSGGKVKLILISM